jgi:hypothetical protein
VFDSFSQDRTVALAQAAGAEVYQNVFHNYAQQRNDALAGLKTGWVFFVDADERGMNEPGTGEQGPLRVAAEIRQVIANRPEMGWYTPQLHFWQVNLWRRLVPRLPVAPLPAW